MPEAIHSMYSAGREHTADGFRRSQNLSGFSFPHTDMYLRGCFPDCILQGIRCIRFQKGDHILLFDLAGIPVIRFKKFRLDV